jgi:hypothetical protein
VDRHPHPDQEVDNTIHILDLRAALRFRLIAYRIREVAKLGATKPRCTSDRCNLLSESIAGYSDWKENGNIKLYFPLFS